MSCKKCDETEGIAYCRVGKANVGIIGCDEHLNEVMRAIDGRGEDRPIMRMIEPPKTMNTPDTEMCICGEQECIGGAEVEIAGVCHRPNNPCYIIDITTPDTDVGGVVIDNSPRGRLISLFGAMNLDVAKPWVDEAIAEATASRDTYWKERVRKDEQGWEGYVVVDPQSNNYKCSPIFFSVKEAEKWRRDFGEPALKVETVDIILKTKHE